MSYKSGLINLFNNSITELFKVCREIRKGLGKKLNKQTRETISCYLLFVDCYKRTYKEEHIQVLEYHLPLFEKLLEKLTDTFIEFNVNDDSWIYEGNLQIIYGSDRGEFSKKVCLRLSEFYSLAKELDKKEESDEEEESDKAGDFICDLIKVLNTCPKRREMKLEGKLLEALSNYDAFEDESSESSSANGVSSVVDQALSVVDNTELVGKVSGVVGKLVQGLGLPPLNPQQNMQAQTSVSSSNETQPAIKSKVKGKNTRASPHYE